MCVRRCRLRNQQPEHDHQCHKQEESGQELLIDILRCSGDSGRRPSIIDIKGCSKNTEGKSTNSKGHLETAISEAKALEAPSILRLRPLSLWPRRGFLSGILLASATSPVQWNNLFSADACFTYRANLSVRPGLQPLMQARPTEKMST